MSLQELLNKRKGAILKDWFEAIVATYPEETSRFLSQKRDKFANPVGATLSAETEHIFDELAAGRADSEDTRKFLDRIIRIRAVQDFKASHAVAFILDLKGIVRGRLAKDDPPEAELAAFDRMVDQLLLAAFDIYAACRQQIIELKVNEMRNLYAKVLERSGVFAQFPDQEGPDLSMPDEDQGQ